MAASFNEKLLLSNGLVISPLKNAISPGQYSHSLKEVIHAIDNKKDLEDYITSFHSKLTPKTSEPKYERNPVRYPPSIHRILNIDESRFLIPSIICLSTKWRKYINNQRGHPRNSNSQLKP